MWYDEETEKSATSPFWLGSTGLDLCDYGIMSEQGLNDLILDPDFDNGLFYVIYNGYRPDGTGTFIDERLVCFGTSRPPRPTIPGRSHRTRATSPRAQRGQLHFGPLDGYLYMCTRRWWYENRRKRRRQRQR